MSLARRTNRTLGDWYPLLERAAARSLAARTPPGPNQGAAEVRRHGPHALRALARVLMALVITGSVLCVTRGVVRHRSPRSSREGNDAPTPWEAERALVVFASRGAD